MTSRYRGSAQRGSRAFFRIGAEHAGELARRAPAGPRRYASPGSAACREACPQLVERRQGGEGLDPRCIELLLPRPPPTILSFSFLLAYSTATFAAATGSREKAIAVGPVNMRRELLELRAREGETREPVLRHFEAGARRPHLPPQIRHLRDRHAGLVGDDDAGGVRQRSMQRGRPASLFVPGPLIVSDLDPSRMGGSVARGRSRDARFACPRSRPAAGNAPVAPNSPSHAGASIEALDRLCGRYRQSRTGRRDAPSSPEESLRTSRTPPDP